MTLVRSPIKICGVRETAYARVKLPRFAPGFILDPRALLFCACLASRSFLKPADVVKRGLWDRECPGLCVHVFFCICQCAQSRVESELVLTRDESGLVYAM